MARVQAFSGTNTTFASSVVTNAVTTTTGNLLIAICEADVVAANGITITDSKSNTWTRVISTALAATFDLEVWVAQIVTGGASHTVTGTDNGGGVDSIIIVEEWSGMVTTSNAAVIDKSAGATGTASTALNSGASAATTQNDEVVIGAGAVSLTTLTLGAGYTNLTTAATAFSRLGFESKIVSATGAQTATMTAGVNASWCCQVATFKVAAAPAAASSPTNMMMGV